MMDFWAKALEDAPAMAIGVVGILAMALILSRGIKKASDRCHDVTDKTLDILKETGKHIGENTEAQKETRVVLRELHHSILRMNGKE